MYDYRKRNNENDFEWKLRLIKDKIEKSIDLDWSEIKDILQLNCSGDHLRKTSYGIYEYHKYLNDKTIDNENNFSIELDEKIMELQKAKVQFQDQRRELNKIVRDEARFEHIQSEILNAVKDVAKQKPIKIDKVQMYPISNYESALIISDWHKGLFAKNYWNNFNEEEFARRVERLVTKTIEYCYMHNVSKLHAFIIGDLVNGLIHVTSRINATEDAISQTMSVAEVLAEVLCKLANHIKDIRVYFARGNHDRVTPNKNDEIAKESFADVILWYLKARLINVQNIIFMENIYDEEIVTANICGYKVYAVHGHRDRPSSVVQDLSLMTKEVPDYILMGHYHHHEENEIHSTEVIVNSSLSGVDCYAKDIRRTGKPAQKLIIFCPVESRLATYNIRLDIK